MCALGFGGGLPAHGVYAQGAHAAKHATDGAVLARGVGTLQHHEQLVALVGVEQVLQPVQFHRQVFDGCLVLGLVTQREGFGAGIEVFQRHGVPGRLAAPFFGRRLCRRRLPGQQALHQRGLARIKRKRHGDSRQGSGSGAIGTLRGPQRYPLCAGACCHWSCSPSTRTMARRARSSSVRPLIHPTFTPCISPIGVSVPWPNTRTPQWRQK